MSYPPGRWTCLNCEREQAVSCCENPRLEWMTEGATVPCGESSRGASESKSTDVGAASPCPPTAPSTDIVAANTAIYEREIQRLCQKVIDAPRGDEDIETWARRLAWLVVDADD
jgi:hypothetical protein